MRIGELAARTGVSTRLLRYYEAQGLISSQREANGYRDYPDGAVERVDQVRDLIDAGIPTAVILDMIPCLASVTDPEAPVIARALAESLSARRAQLEQRIGCLSKNRDAIAAYLERATITS
ncbi:MerR family transcriptional regulator [Agromyces lapidis]|uniref:MerR family transcriptional regulator n=1 Tax=Agromyces lapidis TaxID=279574 RepID=A0ABV5SV10_9MICO|nr:MerR family transcriptional regulator [Agromyces lapidis]